MYKNLILLEINTSLLSLEISSVSLLFSFHLEFSSVYLHNLISIKNFQDV